MKNENSEDENTKIKGKNEEKLTYPRRIKTVRLKFSSKNNPIDLSFRVRTVISTYHVMSSFS